MEEPNYAVNQRLWDSPHPPLILCYRKGQEHAAYDWCPHYPAGDTSREARAYRMGYNGDAWNEEIL